MVAAASDRPFKVLVLHGDGIGPEIISETLRIADWFERKAGLSIEWSEGLAGGAAIDAEGTPVSAATLKRALASDAILFGAVGGPKWDHLPRAHRPEMGILGLRQALDLYANLRPAICFNELLDASTLKPELIRGLDILIVREATAGVYFSLPRANETDPSGQRRAYDTQAYDEAQIARVCRTAFELARSRKGRLCSVDKANVMETGALWRTIATEVGSQYPDVELSHMYADNCAMQLVSRPGQFDVIVTDNLFGDILSDAAAALTGSLGLLPSASLSGLGSKGRSRGLYEPIHGSAPDIAGKGIANPLAAILSFGLAMRWSFDRPDLADQLETAVRNVVARGVRTPDIAAKSAETVTTRQMTEAVLTALDASQV
jgi:3-isopropylmalate dehydrogenase